MHANQFTPVDDRFWSNVYMEPMSGCWLWTGRAQKIKKTRDQPVFSLNGKRIAVYRWSYARFVGPIPEGLLVCHKCDIPLCVNPYHLFVGTHKDNQDDAARKGRATFQIRPLKEKCKRGHYFTPENTIIGNHKDGHLHRHCRACAHGRWAREKGRT